jgi:hypothetical protein
MSQIPIQVFLFPLLGIAYVVYAVIARKKRVQGMDQEHSDYRAGELARRLGLQLVAGDPAYNLFIREASAEIRRGATDDRAMNIEIRMHGAPKGVPLELSYHYRVEQESGFSSVTRKVWFECSMSAQAARPFPPFEVISRSTPVGPIAQTQVLPQQHTGNPQVDATYQIGTSEPGIAQLLGQVLGGFAEFANSGVHLVGDGRRVSFLMKHDQAPLLANALYYAETMATQLSELARRLGG